MLTQRNKYRVHCRPMTMFVLGMALFGAMCNSASAAEAGKSGNVYTNGQEGVQGASLPPKGVYLRWYNLYYDTDTTKDAQGKAQNVGMQVGVFATVPRIIWTTPKKMLGGDVIFAGLVPITYQDARIDASNVHQHAAHLGDVDVSTLLAWHGKRYDLAAGADWVLPTGAWDANSAVKPGNDEFTIMPDLGGTYYFDAQRKWNASVLARFEYHTAKRKQDIHMGDDMHFEWGAARDLNKPGMKLGAAGYAQWKVTDDSGKDVTWTPTAHDRVFAAGPELDMPLPRTPYQMQMRGEVEFGARSRTAGEVLSVVFTRRM